METRTIIAPRGAETWLVVDDFSPLRRLLGHWLRRAGLPAVCAADGREAWDLLMQRPWAGLVTDCAMPGLDGIALVRRVRGEPRLADLPVLMVSAESGPDFRRQALQAGADAILGKPCTATRLVAAVRRVGSMKIPAAIAAHGE